MADTSRILQLILGQRKGTLTAQQEKELSQWIAESPQNKEMVDNGLRPDALNRRLDLMLGARRAAIREALWQRLEDQGPGKFTIEELQSARPAPRGHIIWRWAAAAGIAGLVAGAVVLSQKASRQPLAQQYPGSAILIDGKDSIATDKIKIGDSVKAGGTWVTKKDSDQLTLRWIHTEGGSSLTIYLPEGQDSLRVTLPDQSESTLLSGRLTVFQPEQNFSIRRQARLNGIAYFNIKGDPMHPFTIQTPHSQTQVLGTYFWISAAVGQNSDSITLFSGRLKVSNARSSRTLEAGQEASVDSLTGDILVRNLDEESSSMAWRGAFDFTNQSLGVAMERIRKRYRLKRVEFGPDVDTSTPGLLSEGLIDKNLGIVPTINVLNKIKKNELKFLLGEDSTLRVLRW